jgi:glycerophosphoryl diester phosphodiesterase
MIIIGHRGARGLAPENTVRSIKRALANHVDMIEIDLRMQDGVIVLSHDPIEQEGNYTTLSDALQAIAGKVAINLEIKDPDVVAPLKAALARYKGKVVISSFEYKILQLARNVLPTYEIAVLEKWSAVRGITEARLLGTKRVHFNQQWLWSRLIYSLKHHGYEVYAYTVNSRDRAEELAQWGVDGIFTDYPSLFNNRK